jgi:hypothetical protein
MVATLASTDLRREFLVADQPSAKLGEQAHQWLDAVNCRRERLWQIAANFPTGLSSSRLLKLIVELENAQRELDAVGCPAFASSAHWHFRNFADAVITGLYASLTSGAPSEGYLHAARVELDDFDKELARLGLQ